MSKQVVKAILGISAALFASYGFADSLAIKPGSPVSVQIRPVSTASQGTTVSFVVQASSAFESENFFVNVSLPEGAELKNGDIAWQGKIYAGDSRQLVFTVEFGAQSNAELSATAAIYSDNGESFAAQAQYIAPWMSRSVAQKQADSKPQPRETLRNGIRIVEYPVE